MHLSNPLREGPWHRPNLIECYLNKYTSTETSQFPIHMFWSGPNIMWGGSQNVTLTKKIGNAPSTYQVGHTCNDFSLHSLTLLFQLQLYYWLMCYMLIYGCSLVTFKVHFWAEDGPTITIYSYPVSAGSTLGSSARVSSRAHTCLLYYIYWLCKWQ